MPQGQITGSTSCNKYVGNVNLENNAFKINSIGSTRMACRDMTTEQLFLQTLEEVATYKIENDKLLLMTSEKSIVMEYDYLHQRE